MKLLIDIPNSLYANLSKIKNGSIATRRLLECVKHGAPYDPKGDLISRDDLLKRVDEEREYLKERGQTGAEHILVKNFRDLVEDAPSVSPFKAIHDELHKGEDVITNDDIHNKGGNLSGK